MATARSPRTALTIVLALFLATLIFFATPAAASTGNFGSRVLAADTDFNPQYAALGTTPTLCWRDTGTTASVLDVGDVAYINADGAGTIVATFDVRITTGGSLTAGTMVGSGDTDTGLPFSA